MPILTDKLIHHPLTPDMAVIEHLFLLFFPKFMGRLDACDIADVAPRYRRDLEAETLFMVTSDLAADLLWT